MRGNWPPQSSLGRRGSFKRPRRWTASCRPSGWWPAVRCGLTKRSFNFLPIDCSITPNRTSRNLLTDREEKVLLGILGGLTNGKIGENIGLSEGSVKGIVQQVPKGSCAQTGPTGSRGTGRVVVCRSRTGRAGAERIAGRGPGGLPRSEERRVGK